MKNNRATITTNSNFAADMLSVGFVSNHILCPCLEGCTP